MDETERHNRSEALKRAVQSGRAHVDSAEDIVAAAQKYFEFLQGAEEADG